MVNVALFLSRNDGSPRQSALSLRGSSPDGKGSIRTATAEEYGYSSGRSTSRERTGLDVSSMTLIVIKIAYAMVSETSLPHRPVKLQAEGESPFNKLHSSLQRNRCRGSEQCMNVIRHNDKLMQ